jgi:hypothetical protein
LVVIQSHSQKQLLRSTKSKAAWTLLLVSFGSQNYPPATDYTMYRFVLFFAARRPPPAVYRFILFSPSDVRHQQQLASRAQALTGKSPPRSSAPPSTLAAAPYMPTPAPLPAGNLRRGSPSMRARPELRLLHITHA